MHACAEKKATSGPTAPYLLIAIISTSAMGTQRNHREMTSCEEQEL